MAAAAAANADSEVPCILCKHSSKYKTDTVNSLKSCNHLGNESAQYAPFRAITGQYEMIDIPCIHYTAAQSHCEQHVPTTDVQESTLKARTQT